MLQRVILLLSITLLASSPVFAQLPALRHGEAVPRDVREMYDRGLQYLASQQTEQGIWAGGYQGPGTTGMAVMAFLASGEDPNFGVYSNHIRRGLRSMIAAQDEKTGYFGNSMYHHGFAMLCLAEAYGAVDDRNLWSSGAATSNSTAIGMSASNARGGKRSIGEALELAVRAAITSQKSNTHGAWRYSPQSNDADTSVSGAVLVGLLAARNAGIEVPDESIDKAIGYYTSMTSDSGQVGYSGGFGGGFGESTARSSIACLVYAIARRKDLPEYQATLEYLTSNLEQTTNNHYQEYADYYEAQALFQGDLAAWEKWNKLLVRRLKAKQQQDGSFAGQFGPEVSTQLSLLALAVNFRFLPIYER